MSKEPEYNEEKRSAEDKALDRFADMLIEKIKSISEDWKKPWFTEGALTWPKNLDGRDYNGMNALMLMMHCEKEGFKVPVFMTFDRVAGLNFKGGRKTGSTQAVGKDGQPLPQVSVNKGAKSFPVFLTTFTVVNPDTHEKIKYDDYKKLPEEEKAQYKVFPKLNVYNVFNVDQTNIAETRPELYQKLVKDNAQVLPEGVNGEGESFSFPVMDEMISKNLWLCPITPKYGDDAYYSISRDQIVTPEKKQFKDGMSFYTTAFHEMVHSTGAKGRLDRLSPDAGFGSKQYSVEELIAELGAALLAKRFGMTKNIKEDSAAYLKSWLDNLKESPEFIKLVLTDVKKATAMIITEMEKVERAIEEGRIQEHDNVRDSVETSVQEGKEDVAAQTLPSHEQETNYAIFSAGVGRYVRYISNPLVSFGEKEDALLFPDRETARAAARECKYYMPGERFTLREMKPEQKQVDGQTQAKPDSQAPLMELGTYDIPQWALNYMVNGDAEGLKDEEIVLVDQFVEEHFPNGYLMQIDWNDTNEFNRFPAFGPRNEQALTRHGESPYLATSTVSVEFRDPLKREMKQPQVSPDELGVITHPNKEVWQVTLVGAFDSSEIHWLKDRARHMNGIPSSEDGKYYFLKESDAIRFNHSPGAFRSMVEPDSKDDRERMTDMVVELRGESRQPWLSGKVDGMPVLAKQLTPQEFSDYISNKVSVEDLGAIHFKDYLAQNPEETENYVRSR